MNFFIRREKGFHGGTILRIETTDYQTFFLPMNEKEKFIEELKKIKE